MIVTKSEAIKELRTELKQILDGLWRITENGGQVLRNETESESYRIAILTSAINCLEDVLQAQQPTTQFEAWISVKDRLPEPNEIDSDGMVLTLWKNKCCQGWWADMLGQTGSLITHWMPLPEPPESEVNNG